jgi:hypothetical protein
MTYRLLAAGALALGCYSGKPRPVPPVAEEIVAARVSVTHAAAVRAVTDLGLPLRFADEATGAIETDYVDVTTYRPDAAQYPAPERHVRFRIVVAPHEDAPASRLTVFALYSPYRTGLSNVRRGERALPRDHPGMDLVRRIVTQVQKSAGGGS